MRYFFDTETYPIRPGLLAPKLVCLQYAYDGEGPSIALAKDAAEVFRKALDTDCEMVAHNGSFDHGVMAAHDESLIQPIFKMLAAHRGRDTMLRETLKSIAEGTLDFRRKKKGEFALGTLAERYCRIALDKGEDSWRLRYALLDGIQSSDWPADARKYAEEDVTALRAVDAAQRAQFSSPDEGFQCAAAFALQLCAVWGMRVDPVTLSWVEVSLLTKRDAAASLLEAAGFFRDGSVNKKLVQQAVVEACEKLGKPVIRTEATALQIQKAQAQGLPAPEGAVRTNAETIEAIAEAHPVLSELVAHGAANKILSTYILPMKGGVHHAMNSRPNVLVTSGRTSWGGSKLKSINPWWRDGVEGEDVQVGTNCQNWPREEGVRDCVVPREGHWWLSVDYDSLELRALAQCLLWVVGESHMARRYQQDANYDPHTDLASQLMSISYEEAMVLKKKGDKNLKERRQLAKAAVFGFPGGSSAKTFVNFAKSTYGLTVGLDEAYALKDTWFNTFKEMRGYFEFISWVSNNSKPLKQFVSGRLRGDVGFCDGSNSLFQGLAADGAKAALFAVSMACYAQPDSPLFGCRPVAFIHDEICAEVPVSVAHETAFEVVRLMEQEMSKVCPDIPIRASPALSTRWLKNAEMKYADGRLVACDL